MEQAKIGNRERWTNMIIGIKMEGRNFLSIIFVIGSNTAYETKKMLREALYWPSDKPRSVWTPAILALPMFVRSKKARR